MINEAFDNKRREFGEVAFNATSFNDPYIKKMLDLIAHKQGKSPAEVQETIQKSIDKFQDIAAKSKILYETIIKNIVENKVFTASWKEKVEVPSAPKFELPTFTALMSRIKAEHDQFFPLRNFIDHKRLKSPLIIFVPSKREEHAKFNNIPTAAATATGEFVFNTEFMQSLLNFAHVKEIKPKSKKYACNGGPIPDEYAYIEFVIIHEFMHFTYADFHYQSLLKADGKVINWVGDFRTNYLLVKSGYEQLPMGLFSDHVNYDRQNTYREMYELVKAEFDKLSKDQQDKLSDAFDESTDEHSQSEPSDGSKTPKDPEKEIEKQNENVNDALNNSTDGKEKKPTEDGNGSPEPTKSGRPGNGSGGAKEFDYSKVRPTFTWKKLLDKMIVDMSSTTEETYQRPNRRNITGVHLSAQMGAAAMKPGEVPLENALKLGFVVDSSGSMLHALTTVYSNLNNLLKTHEAARKSDFFLLKFDSSHQIFKCNFQKSSAFKIETLDLKAKSTENVGLQKAFTTTTSGGTVFDGAVVHDVEVLLRKKFNVLIMSDSDILHGQNFENFARLLNQHNHLFVILEDRETFENACKLLKKIPRNLTYFDTK